MAWSGSEQIANIPWTSPSRETYPPMDERSVSTLIRPESGTKLRADMSRKSSVEEVGAAAGVGTAGDLYNIEVGWGPHDHFKRLLPEFGLLVPRALSILTEKRR